jgi:hypothetical protein
MRMACPHCGSTRIVRDREDPGTAECIRAGRVVDRPTRVLRVTCRDPLCGRSGTLYPEADLADRRAVREYVVGRVFAVGQTAAALECGLERPAVQRHLRDWSRPLDEDAAEAAPDFLMVEVVHLRREDRYLAIDVDRETLVEIAFGRDALREWVGTRSEPPSSACLPPDPALHALLREAAPDCRTFCAPAAIRRRTRVLALSALAALRRKGSHRGSNGMPRMAEFERALSGRGDTEAWPLEAMALLGAARTALAVLDARGRSEGERLWAEMALAGSGGAPGRVVAAMEAWREAALDGLDHRWVDGVLSQAEAARRALVLRRPVLGMADIRRLALLRDFERRSGPPIRPDRLPEFAAWGRDLASLPRDLAA